MLNRYLIAAAFVFLAGTAATTAKAQASGAEIYKTKCQMCHGATGLGDSPAGKALKATPFNTPDFIKASDASLLAIIKDGKNKMPGFTGKLKDAQISEVLAYIRTLAKN